MSEKESEKSEMSSVETFCQHALHTRIAPKHVGSVKERIYKAARALGWPVSRTKDAWYAAPRMSLKPHEVYRVEAVSGLKYAQQEVRKNDEAIERATALIGEDHAHLVSAIVAAVRSALGLHDRP